MRHPEKCGRRRGPGDAPVGYIFCAYFIRWESPSQLPGAVSEWLSSTTFHHDVLPPSGPKASCGLRPLELEPQTKLSSSKTVVMSFGHS